MNSEINYIFKIFSFLFILISLSLNALCQQVEISGNVQDSSGVYLSDVIVIANSGQKQFYALTNAEGFFKLTFLDPDSSENIFTIKFRLIGYHEKIISTLVSDVKLIVPTVILIAKNEVLSEVIVKTKPILKRGDTTEFNVSSFKSKLDVSLEDVLKKMPGMDVDDAGNIKYNNKAVENIMIEGDLLSKNYKLISKNITPDMVDKVELIDKYNSNPVLKDLTNSQKQIMNLVLKNPKKLRAFGNLKMGAGIENKLNLGGNMFVINSKIKSMTIANHNNTGQSPYSEFSVDEQFARTREYEFDQTILPNYINENNLFFQSFLSSHRNSLFNNSNLGVINNSYRVNKKLVFKLFTDLYKDRVNQYQQTIVQNNIFSNLSYKESIEKNFTPVNFNNNFEVKFSTEKSQLLIAASYINKKYAETNTLNSLTNFETNLSSTYKRVAVGAYYTHRIDSLKAFEVSVQYNKDDKNQLYAIVQDKYRLLDTRILTNFQDQQTSNSINYLTAEVKFFFKKKSTNELRFKSTFFDSKLNTALLVKDNLNNIIDVPNYTNNNNILNNDFLLNYKTSFALNKFSINTDIGFLYNNNTGNSLLTKVNNGRLYAVPKLRVSFKLNNIQQISANVGLDVSYPSLNNTYLNPLINAYRSIRINAALPTPIQSLKYGLEYSYLDFNNATSFVFSFNHTSQFLSEIRSYKFTTDFDYSSMRYEPVAQNFNNIYTKFDKYIYSINTGISLKNSLLSFSNPMEVNGKITSKKFLGYNSSLTLRPKFNKDINSSLGIEYSLNKDIQSGFSSFQLNPFFDLLVSVSKKISFGSRLNYFYTDFAVKKLSYVFANVHAFYTIKAQKIDAKFSLVNLLNTNGFLTGNLNTAISKSINTAILPRFGILEFTFKF